MADYDGRDAIYVVTVGEDGLPVVGHALLYFQDATGIWYVTEYTGSKKSNAKVYIRKTTEEEMQAYISSNGRYAIYIDGDFSACYDLAMEYKDTYYGGYLFFANNCLHYVKELLRAGSPDYLGFLPVINSAEICPMTFYNRLRLRQRYDNGTRQRAAYNPGTTTRSAKGVDIYACQIF